jgi:hypothetical protein
MLPLVTVELGPTLSVFSVDVAVDMVEVVVDVPCVAAGGGKKGKTLPGS